MDSSAGVARIRHGVGTYAQPDAPAERWGGRRAIEYVAATIRQYGEICISCGLPGSDSADHIIPRSIGGAVYDLDNLGPSHKSCNYSRGAKPLRHATIKIESGISWFTAA